MQSGKVESRALPWLMWGIAALFYFYEYYLQVSPNVMAAQLMAAFEINASQLGTLGGIYYVAYSIMQLPVGILLDYYGPRRALIAATLICMFGVIVFGLTDSYTHALAARFFIGIGSAFAAISCLKVAANWFPIQRSALLVGLTVTAGILGGIFGQGPLVLLMEAIGWRYSLIALGFFSGFITLLAWMFLKDHPSHPVNPHLSDYTTDDLNFTELLKGFLNILKNVRSWPVALYGGLMFSTTTVLGGLWGSPFLKTVYHISDALAANLISMMFIGWIIGGPTLGHISDKYQRRKPVMIIGPIGGVIFTSLFLYVHMSHFFLGVCLFLIGIFSSAFLPAFSIIKEVNSTLNRGTALGFMNCMNMISSVFIYPLIGKILDYTWAGEIKHDVHIYTMHGYHLSLAILPLCFVFALALLPFVKETYGKQLEA